MALTSQSKFQNFKASLDYYAKTNLVTASSLVVDFEGLPFESTAQSEWVQLRTLGSGDRAFQGNVGVSQKGTRSNVLVSFNIFVVKTDTLKINRHYEIRDLVAKYFGENIKIDLYDFENGNFTTSLQKMVVREIITDQPIPDPDYHQWNFTIGVEWLQVWT